MTDRDLNNAACFHMEPVGSAVNANRYAVLYPDMQLCLSSYGVHVIIVGALSLPYDVGEFAFWAAC
jgi:hypothetical protein